MENIFEKVFDRSPIIQIITDDGNFVVQVNSRFEEYFGFKENQIKGKHVSKLLSTPEDVDVIDIRDEEYPNVWEVVRQDGRRRFIAIETTNINGHHLITAYDITKDAFRARNNSLNVSELKKYLINEAPYE